MANSKYADPSYTDTNATDDDRVMLRTSAGGDARAPIVQPKGYIDGLVLVWVSASQIQVTAGAAYIPGIKRVLELPATLTKNPALAASTWYHAYLYLNGSSADVEFVTTAPASSYSGFARTKTGDVTRRYIGSVVTDTSGAIIKFIHSGGQITYTEGIARNLAGGVATSFTVVSIASQVPVVANLAIFAMTNAGSAAFRVRPIGYSNAVNTRMYGLTAGAYVVGPVPLSSTQTYEYQVDSGGSGNVDLIGYYLPR